MLEERLAAQLHDQFGMSHREYEVLVRLDGAGGRLGMSELAAQMVASQPLMSQTVNRLEKRGWVAREPSSRDRRSIETVLGADGRAALREAAGPHAELVKSLLLENVGPVDLETFARSVQRAAEYLRNLRRETH
jgi:DNA-binding MarR family transcriptional regulator